ncbi:MAG: hypothetical protein CMC79_00080 [Flavobacteriaceae bacterium]|nr:hypothetical protein [Flavobacteriaceae bacterium]
MKFKLLSLLIFFTLNAYSQVELEGVVKDKKTNTPIEDVRIQLKPISSKGAGYWTGTMTKQNGLYKVSTTMKLPAQISYEKEGCGKKTIRIRTGDEDVAVVVLNCSDEAIAAIIKEQTTDTDGDGLVDKHDKCPKEAGVPENEGCPAEEVEKAGPSLEEIAAAEKAKVDALKASKAKADSALGAKIKSSIKFTLNSYVVSSSGNNLLREIRDLLVSNPSAKIYLHGHASTDGSSEYNQVLSENRASAVKKILVDLGIDSSRIKSMGHGEDNPLESNSSSRRVEISMQ